MTKKINYVFFLFFREKCYFNKNLKGRILGLFTIKLIFN